MSFADLIINAVTNIDTMALLWSMFSFTIYMVASGMYGALLLSVYDRTEQAFENQYWETLETELEDPFFKVPSHMQHWPTWEEELAMRLEMQEQEWEDLGLTQAFEDLRDLQVFTTTAEMEALMEVPEPVAYLEQEDLDGLWERIEPHLHDHPANNIWSYMRAHA